MSKKTKTPPAPDYKALAEQEAASNLQANQTATTANRVNQTNPFGSLTWKSTTNPDGTQSWTQDMALNANDQSQLDANRGISSNLYGQVESATQNPFSLDDAPEMGESGFGAVQEIQDAMMSRMAPDLLRQRQRQEAQLIAQGVGGNTGSEAWGRAQTDLGRNENDASMQSLLAGAKEYGNIYDRKMQNRNQWIAEQEGLRKKPMEELMTMLRGREAYNPQFEGFYNQEGAGGTKYGAAGQQQYGAAADAAAAKAAGKSQTMSTIGSIAGTAAMFF